MVMPELESARGMLKEILDGTFFIYWYWSTPTRNCSRCCFSGPSVSPHVKTDITPPAVMARAVSGAHAAFSLDYLSLEHKALILDFDIRQLEAGNGRHNRPARPFHVGRVTLNDNSISRIHVHGTRQFGTMTLVP